MTKLIYYFDFQQLNVKFNAFANTLMCRSHRDFQVNISAAWGFLAAVFIIVMPVVSEAFEIWSAVKEKKMMEAGEIAKPQLPSPSRSGSSHQTLKHDSIHNMKLNSNGQLLGSVREVAAHKSLKSIRSAETIEEQPPHESPRAPVF